MRKIKVNKAYAYSVGFNVTTKKVYYTNKGSYIIYFGHRVYLNDFLPVDFYGMEFVGGRK